MSSQDETDETAELATATDEDRGADLEETTIVEDVDPQADDEELPFIYSITSYGADYPIDGLVKRIGAGDIEVPDFQRGFIWSKPKCDRFLESLLLGLPVPGIFLAREPNSAKMLVIDGQQRLRTLESFYGGILRGREFTLGAGVQEQFRGKTYANLDEEDRRRLDDSIIHATVVRQDEPSDDQSSVYFVFERLNTGGTLLQPQEIRTAIYQGGFNDLLAELNDYEPWRWVFGKPSPRMKDRELILRFFAFHHAADQYQRPMKEFLNAFIGAHRDLSGLNKDELVQCFCGSLDLLVRAVPTGLFRRGNAINAAVFDSVMVGIARKLATDSAPEAGAVAAAYAGLLANEEYVDSVGRATADEANVERRLALATRAFSE